MAIKYYDTEFGTFTVIADTTIFNTVNSNNVATYPPWEDVITTIAMGNVLAYSQETLNFALSKLKSVNLKVIYGLSTNNVSKTFLYNTSNENSKIGLVARCYNSQADIRCLFSINVNGHVNASSRDHNAPYGSFGTYNSGAGTPNSISIEVIVCNDEMTEFKTISMSIEPNGAFTYDVYNNYYDANETLTLIEFFKNIKPTPQPGPDPYAPGGHSGGGGGTGKFSRTGDTIGEHNVPTLSATDAGFITLFAPTAREMKALASYLWSDLFSIDTFKKIFANPMDAILGLSIVPVAVPTSGSASIKVGNISTGVSMTKASTQYVKLSCGSLEVEEYWGAYLDYSPYTKCEIYLPYIGVHELSVDDVMGKTVKVVYYIDILSGACTAEIYSNSTCLYSFVGQCSASIPITGNDWTNVINGVMQIGASIGSMVASGGLTAPISAGGVASGLKSVASASSTVTSSKPSVERSGSMSGAGGMLGQQTPYLIITWPRECIPADQNKYIGYPSYVTVNLGEIVGFNIVDSIHLENIPATSAELDEIESLLMNGVIF